MTNFFEFKKSSRILKTSEFKRIYNNGYRINNAFFKFYFLKCDHKAFGVVVSRKIKGAVKRNRYKRIFREYFRLRQYLFKPGLQVVVVITREINAPNLKKITEELDQNIGKNPKIIGIPS